MDKVFLVHLTVFQMTGHSSMSGQQWSGCIIIYCCVSPTVQKFIPTWHIYIMDCQFSLILCRYALILCDLNTLESICGREICTIRL